MPITQEISAVLNGVTFCELVGGTAVMGTDELRYRHAEQRDAG